MKKYTWIIILLVFSQGVNASNLVDSTWFRGRQGKLLKYVILPEADNKSDVIITEVTLKKEFLLAPVNGSFTIDIYNFLFNDKLAVFSLMPSYKNLSPAWVKINIDTIAKSRLINTIELRQLIDASISKYPAKPKSLYDNLKYWNYALLKKEKDGWYCSTTDCFTEFFEIINDPSKAPNKSYQINLKGKQLSNAEYEANYRRQHGTYSTNTKTLNGFNTDVANGDLLYNSYIDNTKGEKTYHFWLLSEWVHDGGSQQRGMDRFTFKPGIGVTSASYDFFVPQMFEYWSAVYLKKLPESVKNTTVIHAPLMGETGVYLEQYFTEYTIPNVSIKVLYKP